MTYTEIAAVGFSIAFACAFVGACIEMDTSIRTEAALRRIYGAGTEVACPYRGAGMLSCMVRRPDGVIVRVRCGADGCAEVTR